VRRDLCDIATIGHEITQHEITQHESRQMFPPASFVLPADGLFKFVAIEKRIMTVQPLHQWQEIGAIVVNDLL
jgi:hypothetical protein